jgi:threonine dehydratase
VTAGLPTLADIDTAARVVYDAMPPTPQYAWPLLREALGAEVWVKHENHAPMGAFKVRGGLVYLDGLLRDGPRPSGVIGATRGNHGQSIGFAARRHGLPATIVVPRGNSTEKNAAMRALGTALVESGEDFQEALDYARALADRDGLHLVPSFDLRLVRGVATYGLELFRGAPDLDVVYVPIGLGSGACGVIAAREALGRTTDIVGVVSAQAPAYADSLAAGAPVEREARTRIADGLACRRPVPQALDILGRHLARVIAVTDDEVEAAMRLLFSATHNVAEGAGAASLAAALQERGRLRGRRIGLILSGCNVDRQSFASVLAG